MRRKYRKKPSQFVVAVQLDLDTVGFTYNKWGEQQVCKRGDWLVDNNGDTYTIDRESFAGTYERVGSGVYAKRKPVWAEIAPEPGRIRTKEGATQYNAGDYLVSNNADGADSYAVRAVTFESMYEPVSDDESQGESD